MCVLFECIASLFIAVQLGAIIGFTITVTTVLLPLILFLGGVCDDIYYIECFLKELEETWELCSCVKICNPLDLKASF